MIYITLDTCVWLELLKADWTTKTNLLEEMIFLIEKKHITCITTKNLNREWNRNKGKKKKEILNDFKKMHTDSIAAFKSHPLLSEIYDETKIEEETDRRIERLDQLFETLAEEAPETEEILLEAARKNLGCQPPNHGRETALGDLAQLEARPGAHRPGDGPA